MVNAIIISVMYIIGAALICLPMFFGGTGVEARHNSWVVHLTGAAIIITSIIVTFIMILSNPPNDK